MLVPVVLQMACNLREISLLLIPTFCFQKSRGTNSRVEFASTALATQSIYNWCKLGEPKSAGEIQLV